ncbi:PEP-CTERM sorting domain-containing protein [Thiohalophilus sp.]|uniref:PEP-CTERM sorting domain-containing protein n=1 Tax=Thiohalophilus sp. TaxID=3028392 RepID=UPI002ACEDDA9|nr:PEP-CTERM sorting domain-containing protein [Thiohalophilus sp.]MDZ7802600.1 PEP-CTERM sorting domain-containing protein [Thiohalophilus sp.]
MDFKVKKLGQLLAIMACCGLVLTSARAVIIDDFEDGNITEYSSTGTSLAATGIVDGSHAQAGSFGLGMGTDLGLQNDWLYRTDISISEGNVLSSWVRFGNSGRAYLGFGADANGTQSFVLAPNTEDIRFQDNFGYGFSELDISSQTFSFNRWYRAEVIWSTGGAVTGNLYDSDGTTLLNTVNSSVSYSSTGGLALRGFSNVSFDTIELNPAAVPEPATLALMALGLFGIGITRNNRRRAPRSTHGA